MTDFSAIALSTLVPSICEINVLSKHNPFYTPEYITYRRSQGFLPWVFISNATVHSKVCCLAFMRTGRLRRSLEIPSIPDISVDAPFWQRLLVFCRQKGVSSLSVNSFCSPGGVIPPFGCKEERKFRWEFVLNLKHPDFLKKMSKGHAYRIKRAKKTGLEMRCVHDKNDVITHAHLISASMLRRKERGEKVTTSVLAEGLAPLIESGAAKLFQAISDGQVLSSNIILMSEKTGYSHTQGTSPEGMKSGAAHFLIHEIACAFREEGKERLNLGGTDDPNPESGLIKFKTGFGMATERIELEAARFTPQSVAASFLQRFLSSERN